MISLKALLKKAPQVQRSMFLEEMLQALSDYEKKAEVHSTLQSLRKETPCPSSLRIRDRGQSGYYLRIAYSQRIP
jgi:hypothetical protein